MVQKYLARAVLNKWFWTAFFIFGLGYPVYRSMNRTLPPPLPVYSSLPSWELISETGSKFGSRELTGRIYVASFIFTRCPMQCPALMKKVQVIQKRIRGLGDRMAIVTFTVDPTYDNSSRLFKYARDLRANPRLWTFLTGKEEEIEKLLIKGFKVSIGEPVSNIMELAHSEKLVLVDQTGRIRGYYGSDTNSVNRLMIDVGLLVNNAFQGES